MLVNVSLTQCPTIQNSDEQGTVYFEYQYSGHGGTTGSTTFAYNALLWNTSIQNIKQAIIDYVTGEDGLNVSIPSGNFRFFFDTQVTV